MHMQTIPNAALAQACTGFLAAPSEAAENAVLAAFNVALEAEAFSRIDDSFIEWRCVEHNVIHILAHNGQQWIEINPVTGVAQTL